MINSRIKLQVILSFLHQSSSACNLELISSILLVCGCSCFQLVQGVLSFFLSQRIQQTLGFITLEPSLSCLPSNHKGKQGHILRKTLISCRGTVLSSLPLRVEGCQPSVRLGHFCSPVGWQGLLEFKTSVSQLLLRYLMDCPGLIVFQPGP